MAKEKRNHYYLVCGTLMLASGGENISSISLNAIVPQEIKNVTVRGLGMAQQALQANFAERMKGDTDELPQVVDVVIASMSYLGHMTPSDFNRPPEGMALAERKPEDALPTADDNPFKG